MGFCVALTMGTATFTGARVMKEGAILEAGGMKQPAAVGTVGRFQTAYSGDTKTPWVIDTMTGKLYQISPLIKASDGTAAGAGKGGEKWIDFEKKYNLPPLLQ